MSNFARFCKAPFDAIEHGFVPCYLDVVSAHAVTVPGLFIGSLREQIREFRKVLDLSIRELATLLFWLPVCIVLLFTIPVWTWPVAYFHYKTLLKHAASVQRGEHE